MNEINNVERYLDGLMAEDEAKSFKLRMDADPLLKEEYDRSILARTISKGLAEVDMRDVLFQAKRRNLLRKGLLIGLGILILFIAFFLSRSMFAKEEVLYAMEYKEPFWPIVRGSEDELSKIFAEFRAGSELAASKQKIQANESLDITMKDYWVAEMFLFRGELDSATVYLPDLPQDHFKFSRTKWFKEFVDNQKDNK